ncbi:MAG: DUF2231 domain-containing protein [Fimbriimonas sp.]
MRLRFALPVAGLLFAASLAQATPKNLEIFRATYGIKDGSPLATCITCHAGPPMRNSFGKAVEGALDRANTSILTADLLKSLDNEDSDGDGTPNLEEIQAGTLPGDANSNTKAKDAGKTPEKGIADLLWPTHSWHPLFVHFPIALFLFGTFLELLGLRQDRRDLRQAGFWAMAGGAISTLAVVPTGLFALNRMSYGWQGIALVHAILALSATGLMVGVTLWRWRQTPKSAGYVIALLLAAVLVGAAGHFGALLVHGF